MSFKKTATILVAIILAISCMTGCSKLFSSEAAASSTLDLDNLFTSRDYETTYDETQATAISMSEENKSVTINKEGVYILSGSCSDGQITVDVGDTDKIQLVLNGLNLTAKETAAIYIKNADKVFITTATDSENTLSTTGEFTAAGDTEVDGVIFSKDDITLNGKGTLTVISESGNGIVGKDDLKITSGNYSVTAANKGIEGNDSIRIAEGAIQINAENDALHSDTDFIIIGGTLKLNTGDDGIHADGITYITGGTVEIPTCYEAIEGTKIYISGGKVNAVSSDDGINASSAKDSEDSQDGRAGKIGMDEVDEDALISISGGTIQIDVGGDGIDSNGSLEISGGSITVSGAENSGNGALDYNGTAKITGGTLIAVGMSGMAQNMSEATQGSVLINFNSTYKGEVKVTDGEGNVLLSFESAKSFNSVVVSAPELKKGETYTVSVGETYQTVTLEDYIYGSGNGFGMMR